jgi:hypothetical protein
MPKTSPALKDKPKIKRKMKGYEEKMTERRKYLRFNSAIDIQYKSLTLNPIFGKTLAKDLSREGLRIGLKERVSVGTPLEICMNVPGDNLPVFASGKVTWADGLEAGVRLTKIDQSDRMRVLEYVYREWLKSSKRLSADKK